MAQSRRGNAANRSLKATSNLLSFPTSSGVADVPTQIEKIGRYLTGKELAPILAMSYPNLLKLAKAGKMPFSRFGGSIKFEPTAVAAWLRERSVA